MSINGNPSFRIESARRSSSVIGRPQGMHAWESYRALADDVARLDLVPGIYDLGEPLESKLSACLIERRLAFETGQGRRTLHSGSPPSQHVGIALRQCLQTPCRLFGDEQRHDGRGVPECHRLFRRSRVSVSTPDIPARTGGG
jgi:hypothetical protein